MFKCRFVSDREVECAVPVKYNMEFNALDALLALDKVGYIRLSVEREKWENLTFCLNSENAHFKYFKLEVVEVLKN